MALRRKAVGAAAAGAVVRRATSLAVMGTIGTGAGAA